MILVHFKNGTTIKLDPANKKDRESIEHPYNQRGITRVSILDRNSRRVDLPTMKNKQSRVWIESLSKNGQLKGERVSMRNGKEILQVTLFFSDGRIVLNVD